MNESKRVIGRIIKISNEGWGFVSCREIEFTRIFFHWTALKQGTLGFKELKTGMMVEFIPIQIPGKGYRAIQISVVERETNDGASENSLPVMSE